MRCRSLVPTLVFLIALGCGPNNRTTTADAGPEPETLAPEPLQAHLNAALAINDVSKRDAALQAVARQAAFNKNRAILQSALQGINNVTTRNAAAADCAYRLAQAGDVVGALTVRETDEMMLITNKGQMVRTRVKEIRETGRNTMGVKLMDLRNGEKLQAIAPVVSQVEEEEAQTIDPTAEKS